MRPRIKCMYKVYISLLPAGVSEWVRIGIAQLVECRIRFLTSMHMHLYSHLKLYSCLMIAFYIQSKIPLLTQSVIFRLGLLYRLAIMYDGLIGYSILWRTVKSVVIFWVSMLSIGLYFVVSYWLKLETLHKQTEPKSYLTTNNSQNICEGVITTTFQFSNMMQSWWLCHRCSVVTIYIMAWCCKIMVVIITV